MNRMFISILIFLFSISILLSQRIRGKQAEKVIPEADFVVPYKNSAFPKMIQFKANTSMTVDDFFGKNRDNLGISKADRFEVYKVKTDEIGLKHYRVKQFHKGLEILGAEYLLHEKDGKMKSANGHIITDLNIDIQPFLTETDAFGKAKEAVSGSVYKWESEPNMFQKPSGKLAISSVDYLFTKESFKLVYRFDIYSETPLARYYVDVDAKTGDIINKLSRIHTRDKKIKAKTMYNNTVTIRAEPKANKRGYYLIQKRSGNGIETYDMKNGRDYEAAVLASNDNKNIFDSDLVAANAHWGAEYTHKYFLRKHRLNSFDGNGSVIRSYVHYGTNYENAFWDGERMTYGDGAERFSPLVSIDVVGHEISHGVTDFSSDLVYLSESGALNESFSDIFGEMVEHYATGSNDWLIGEEIEIEGDGLRNMRDPKADGDPDTYEGENWITGLADYGGVHTNSGVQNYWFYLLSVGGSGTNDNGDDYSVRAIGRRQAAAIAFRNNTVYLTKNSNYSDAYLGSLSATEDLFGKNSREYQAVTDAWAAVGVDDSNAGKGSSPGCSTTLTSLISKQLSSFSIESSEKTNKLADRIYEKYSSKIESVLRILAKSPKIQFDLYQVIKENVSYFGSQNHILSRQTKEDILNILERTKAETEDLETRNFIDYVYNTVENSGENTSYEELLAEIENGLETNYEAIKNGTLGIDEIYPNPFNPVTTVKFNLRKTSQVTLKIYNSLGQEVFELASKNYRAGSHKVRWNANGFASGIYFMQLITNEFSQSKKLILLK